MQRCRPSIPRSSNPPSGGGIYGFVERGSFDNLPEGVTDPAVIYRSVGCAACRQTGYKGRLGIYEMLTMSEEIERLTAASAPSSEIRRQARREGMRTMREDGVLKVLAGHTTLNELSRTVA